MWPGTVKDPDELAPVNIHQWGWWIWIMIMIKFMMSITRVGDARQRDSPMVSYQDLSGWLYNRQMISSATRDRHASYAFVWHWLGVHIILGLPMWLIANCSTCNNCLFVLASSYLCLLLGLCWTVVIGWWLDCLGLGPWLEWDKPMVDFGFVFLVWNKIWKAILFQHR